MIYLLIGLLAGIGILIARARQNVKLRGDKPGVANVTAQLGTDVRNRKTDRQVRRAALKAARRAR